MHTYLYPDSTTWPPSEYVVPPPPIQHAGAACVCTVVSLSIIQAGVYPLATIASRRDVNEARVLSPPQLYRERGVNNTVSNCMAIVNTGF